MILHLYRSAWRRLRALFRRRPPSPPRPEPTEICEVCGEFLAEVDVWEIRSHADDDEWLTNGSTMGGGTYMSATYCAGHFPAGATRWVG